MKLFTRILTLLLIAILAVSLCACEQKSHDEILNEISESNKIRNQQRQEFLRSEVYASAYAYVENALEEILPGCEKTISLEPGALLGESLDAYGNLTEDKAQRLDFFQKAGLSIYTNFWNYDKTGEELGKELTERSLSGSFSADEYGQDRYYFDALTGEVTFEAMPGV